MEESDPITEAKQNYLRENILEKGYDANVFVNFLIEKKGEGGADVSNWSLPDLQNVVKEFINLNGGNEINEGNQQEIIEKQKVEDINEYKEDNEEEKDGNKIIEEKKEENDWVDLEDKKEAKKDTEKQSKQEKNEQNKETKNKSEKSEDNSKKSTYGIKSLKEVKCQTIPNNDFSKCENIQIRVGNYEKVKGNLFSKSYISYLITTLPLNWQVRRRFSDFEWLHQMLVNTYNYCFIPPIPKKRKNLNKIVADRFDEAFLRKRSRKFQKFLSYLINDPILKHTKIVYDFLSIEKEDDFHKKKKVYEKMKLPSKINDFITEDGVANVEINSEKEQYLSNIKENANFNENTFKKINTTIRSVKDDLINAANKLKDLSKNFKSLQNKALEYAEKDEVVQTYEEVSSMFDSLSLYISKQNYIIFIYIREYFKFVKNNYGSMKDFIHTTENLKSSFYKSFKNLKSKKEDLFKKPDSFNKWELNKEDKNISKKEYFENKNMALEKMLYKETNGVNNQKLLYGFYLNRVISEHERLQNVNAERHVKNIVKIFERQTDVSTDFITTLADNSTSLTVSNKDGQKVKKKEKEKKKDELEENLDLEIKKEENSESENNQAQGKEEN